MGEFAICHRLITEPPNVMIDPLSGDEIHHPGLKAIGDLVADELLPMDGWTTAYVGEGGNEVDDLSNLSHELLAGNVPGEATFAIFCIQVPGVPPDHHMQTSSLITW